MASAAARRLVFRLALRNLFRHRTRTLVSLGAIAVGVSAIILSGGFVYDMYVQLREAIIHSQSGHIQVGRSGFFSAGSRSPEKHLIAEPEAEKARIAHLSGVADVMARISFSGLLNNGRTDLPVVGEGIEPDKEAVLGTYLKLTQGHQLTVQDRYGILVGYGLAQALELKPGDRTTLVLPTAEGALNTLDFDVVGVFQSFSQDYDARAVKITLSAAQELLNTAGANLLVISLHRSPDTEAVAALLRERTIWRDMEVRTWEELNAFYQSTVDLYNRQFGVLQLIILFMVLLGVVNAINMSVLERVGEFGTMRALGNRGHSVFTLVVVEGALLGFFGAISGVILGIVLATGISAVGIPMPPPPNSDLGYTAYIRVVPVVVMSALLIGLVAATLASILPAARVARIPVAEALRQNA
jgi:putative ABC transport system permease protein